MSLILQGRSSTSIVNSWGLIMLLLILACSNDAAIEMEGQWWCLSAGVYGIFDGKLYECGKHDPIAECIEASQGSWECDSISISVSCEESSCTAYVGPLVGPAHECECEQ